MVAEAFSLMPVPKDGIDGKDGAPGKDGIDGKDGAPGKDGESMHPDTVSRMVADAVAALPPARDGKDGSAGRDAADLNPLPSIDEKRRYARGTWASYRGGLIRSERDTDPVIESNLSRAGWVTAVEGLSAVLVSQSEEDPRVLSVAAETTSGMRAACSFNVPVLIYRGIWKEGDYQQGDVVTRHGSLWYCNKNTNQAPGDGETDWTLAVKRGARGKDADPPTPSNKGNRTVRLR